MGAVNFTDFGINMTQTYLDMRFKYRPANEQDTQLGKGETIPENRLISRGIHSKLDEMATRIIAITDARLRRGISQVGFEGEQTVLNKNKDFINIKKYILFPNSFESDTYSQYGDMENNIYKFINEFYGDEYTSQITEEIERINRQMTEMGQSVIGNIISRLPETFQGVIQNYINHHGDDTELRETIGRTLRMVVGEARSLGKATGLPEELRRIMEGNRIPRWMGEEESQFISRQGQKEGKDDFEQSYLTDLYTNIFIGWLNEQFREAIYEDGRHYNDMSDIDMVRQLDITDDTEGKIFIKEVQESNRNKIGISNYEFQQLGEFMDNANNLDHYFYGIGMRSVIFGEDLTVTGEDTFTSREVLPEGPVRNQKFDQDAQEYAAKMLINNIKNRLGVDWMVVPDKGLDWNTLSINSNRNGGWQFPLLAKKVINGKEKHFSVFITNNINFGRWFGMYSQYLPSIRDAGFDYAHGIGYYVTDEIVPFHREGLDDLLGSTNASELISNLNMDLYNEIEASVVGRNIFTEMYGWGENGYLIVPTTLGFETPELIFNVPTKYIPPFHNVVSIIDKKYSQGAFQVPADVEKRNQGIINTQFKKYGDRNSIGFASTPNIKDVLTDYIRASNWSINIEEIGSFTRNQFEHGGIEGRKHFTSYESERKLPLDVGVKNKQMFLPEVNQALFQYVVRSIIRNANEGVLMDYVTGNANTINAKDGLYLRNADVVEDGTFINDKLGKKHYIHNGYAYPTEGVIGASENLFSLIMNSPSMNDKGQYLLGQGVYDIDNGYLILDKRYDRKKVKDIDEYKPISNTVDNKLIDLSIMELLFNSQSNFNVSESNISVEYFKNLVNIFNSNKGVPMNQESVYIARAYFDFDYNAVTEKRMKNGNRLKDINKSNGAFQQTLSPQEMQMLLAVNKKGGHSIVSPGIAKTTLQQIYDMLQTSYRAKEITKKDISFRMKILVSEWKKHYVKASISKAKGLKYLTAKELNYLMETPLRKDPEKYLDDVDFIVNLVGNIGFRRAYSKLIGGDAAPKGKGWIQTVEGRASRSKNLPLKQLWVDLANIDLRVFETESDLLEYGKWAKEKHTTLNIKELKKYVDKLKGKELQFISEDYEDDEISTKVGKVTYVDESKAQALIPVIKNLHSKIMSTQVLADNQDVQMLISIFSDRLDKLSYKELYQYWKQLIVINNNKGFNKEDFNFYKKAWAKFRAELIEDGLSTYWWDLMNTKAGSTMIKNFMSGLGNITHYNLKQIINFLDGNTRHYSGLMVDSFINELDRVHPIMQKIMHDLYTRINPKAPLYNLDDADMRIVYIYGVLNQAPSFKMSKEVREKLMDWGLVRNEKALLSKIKNGDILSPTNNPWAWGKINKWTLDNLKASLKLSLGYTQLGTDFELTAKQIKEQKLTLFSSSDIKFDDLKGIRKKIFTNLGYSKERIKMDAKGDINLLDRMFSEMEKGTFELKDNQQKWLDDIRIVFKEIADGTHSEGKSLQYVSETYTGDPISIITNYMPILRYAEFTKHITDLIHGEAGTSSSDGPPLYMNAYSEINVNNNFVIERKNIVKIMNTNAHEVAMSRINQQLFYLYNERQRQMTNALLSEKLFNTNEGHIQAPLKGLIVELLSNFYNRGITKSKSALRNSDWGKKVMGILNRNRVAFLGDFVRQTAQITSLTKGMQTMEGSMPDRIMDMSWGIKEMMPHINSNYKQLQRFIQDHAPEVAFRGIVDFDLGGISRQATIRNVQRAIKNGEIASEKGIWGELWNKYQNKGYDMRTFNEWQLMTLLFWDRAAARITFIANYKNYLSQVGEDVDYNRPNQAGIEFATQAVRETQATDNVLYKPAVLQNVQANDIGADNEWGELFVQSMWAFKSFSLNEKTRLRRTMSRYYDAHTRGDKATMDDLGQEITYDYLGRLLFITMKNALYYFPYVWISQLLLAMGVADDPEEQTPEELKQKWKKLNIAKNAVQAIAEYNQILPIAWMTKKILEQGEIAYRKALDPQRTGLTEEESIKYVEYLETGSLLNSIMDLTVRDGYQIYDDYLNHKWDEASHGNDHLINTAIFFIDLGVSVGSVKVGGLRIPTAYPGMPEVKRQLTVYRNMKEDQDARSQRVTSGTSKPIGTGGGYGIKKKTGTEWLKALKHGPN